MSLHSIHAQDVAAVALTPPGTAPLRAARIEHILTVLNNARADHLHADGSRTDQHSQSLPTPAPHG